MDEKKITKKTALYVVILTVIIIIAEFITVISSNSQYVDNSIMYNFETMTKEDLSVVGDDPDIVSVEDFYFKDNTLNLVLKGHKKGRAGVSISDKNTGETLVLRSYRTGAFNVVYNVSNGNFENYRIFEIILTVYMLLVSVIMWRGYFLLFKRNRYSYHIIFLSGFAIWMSVMTVLIGVNAIRGEPVHSVIGSLQSSGLLFMFCTFPAVLVFAILLTISNISLIRHEGLKRNNMLGILISLMMVGGEVGCYYYTYYFQGSEFEYHLNNVSVSTMTSVYVLFECFLIGSVISLLRAARFEPEPDVDYIIILGCAIRKDGTLYPLIRGRVDRAISFYKKQLEATGKKAVFVPSGGQGSNEIISEGEAMRRYLVEQGIDEEQIMPETESSNTAENMRFSRRLIEEKKADAKVVFSTTNYHVFRSGVISRQAGFEPDGIGAGTKWYFWPNASIREIIGMVVYMKKTMMVLLLLLITLFAFLELLIV